MTKSTEELMYLTEFEFLIDCFQMVYFPIRPLTPTEYSLIKKQLAERLLQIEKLRQTTPLK